jgi:hypothetical protein
VGRLFADKSFSVRIQDFYEGKRMPVERDFVGIKSSVFDLYLGTSKASKLSTSNIFIDLYQGKRMPVERDFRPLWCQYLYLGTSKASKLRTIS